jgi:hypothetical protein
LVEFDEEIEASKAKIEPNGAVVPQDEKPKPLRSIALLVDHIHSIPIARVVQQLEVRPRYLFLYLDALFDKDPHLASEFADRQVELYAEFAPHRLIDFLRASNYYSLEKAYDICAARDSLVLEMVFLLGRMGNNKKALHVIIEKLNDVHRAIDFAKEQNDDDLWEDLLMYSETRPVFIRGLLENVGAEIDPIRLIRRIKNGLEIPGLKEALIKILWDFNLQISLLEGCQTVLHSDTTDFAQRLQASQISGFFGSAQTPCSLCGRPLFIPSPLPERMLVQQQSLALLFLCGHVVHASCVKGGENLPRRTESTLATLVRSSEIAAAERFSSKIAYATIVNSRLREGCPECRLKESGRGSATT